MKYFSEITKKTYDTEEDCLKAEAELTAEKEERKLAAKEVDEAENEFYKARKVYLDKLDEFCKKYGAYHKTISSNNLNNFKEIFDDKFNTWYNLLW